MHPLERKLFSPLPCALFFLSLLFVPPSQAGNIASDFIDSDKPLLHKSNPSDSDDERLSQAFSHFSCGYLSMLERNRFTEYTSKELVRAIELDPSEEMPMRILLSQWMPDGTFAAQSGQLIEIAKRHPELIYLNLVSASGLIANNKTDEAKELLLECYRANMVQKNNLSELKHFPTLVLTLFDLLQKTSDFSTGEEIYDDLDGVSGVSDNFEFRKTAAIFFSTASEKTEDAFLSWTKSRYSRKFDENLAASQKFWGDKLEKGVGKFEQGDFNNLGSIIEILGNMKDFDKSEEMVLGILLQNPDNSAAISFLAKIYSDSGRHELSRRAWAKIVEKSPDKPYYLYHLAHEYLLTGNLEKAVEYFNKCLELNPSMKAAIYQLGVAYFELEQLDKAIETMSKIPEVPISSYIKAMCHGRRKEYPAAVSALLQAEQTAKDIGEKDFLGREFYLTLAGYYEKCGETDRLLDLLGTLDAQYPDDPEISNFLGYMLADMNRDLKRAKDLIEKALSKEPANIAYLDSMAWVLYRLGNYTRAKEFISDAISLSASQLDPVIADHAGDIFWALGENEKALKFWNLAIETPNDDVKTEEVRKKIRETEAAPSK